MPSLPHRDRDPAAAAHPDATAVRRLIARDLAALDPLRRRRYRARLARLIEDARSRRDEAESARAARTVSALLSAAAAGAVSVALVLATAAVEAPPMLRIAFAAAALCAAVVAIDAIGRRRAAQRNEDSPERTALGLHREAFATLSYAADLPPAPPRGRDARLNRR
ncbi:MAG: hypothetical protein ACFCUS_01615 [Rubrimonas sp.]|uniref:hypothetical protein n=1 Tax=Rubrimonas sp. TaxID=2036015 RepID=UPI002FDEBE88